MRAPVLLPRVLQAAGVLLALAAALCGLAAVPGARALHADQAGKVDWLKQNLGPLKLAVNEGKFLLVASEAGAVAALHQAEGSVLWRHVLPAPLADEGAGQEAEAEAPAANVVDLVYHASKRVVLALSREEAPRPSGAVLHAWAWRLHDGALLWHTPLPTSAPASSRAFLAVAGKQGDAVAVADADGFVTFLGLEKGEVQWEWSAGQAAFSGGGRVTGALPLGPASLAVVGESKDHKPLAFFFGAAKPAAADDTDGIRARPAESVKALASAESGVNADAQVWAFPRAAPGAGSILLVGPADDTNAAAAATAASFQVVLATSPSKAAGGSVVVGPVNQGSGAPLSNIVLADNGAVVELTAGGGKVQQRLVVPAGGAKGSQAAAAAAAAVPVPASGSPAAALVLREAEGSGALEVIRVADGASVGRIDVAAAADGRRRLLRLWPDARPRGQGYDLYLLASNAAGTAVMLQGTFGDDINSAAAATGGGAGAKLLWKREEALGQVAAVGFVDLAPDHADEAHASSKEVRFGLAKAALLLTRPHRLLAVTTADGGRVLWAKDLPADAGKWSMAVTRGGGKHPEALLVSATGRALWVDATNGATVGESLELQPQGELLLMPLPKLAGTDGSQPVLAVDKATRRGRILLSSSSSSSSCAAEEQSLLAAGDKPLHYHLLDRSKGRLQCYRLVSEAADAASSSWPLASVEMAAASLPDGETVVAVAYPDAQEAVASPAHVLGDHALLLKYLNPHTVALASTTLTPTTLPAPTAAGSNASAPAEQQQQQQAAAAGGTVVQVPTLYITLLDTVSGRTLHRLSHFYAAGPVSLRLVENWLLYSYWNTKAQRSELGSVSYYDGYLDKGALNPFSQPEFKAVPSSLDGTEAPPLGLQQTFVFPRPVVTLGTTLTARGITSKALLIGYAPGQVVSLDRRVLDPRRPTGKPTNAEKAEGLIPYSPYVPIVPTHVLSYNRTIEGLRRIYTAPTGLESTSLVLAVGLDLFFTRVHPSRPFDILSEEFNHVMVSVILLATVACAWLLSRKARAKTLRDSWA